MSGARSAHSGFARVLGAAAIGLGLMAAIPAAAQSPDAQGSIAPSASPFASLDPSTASVQNPIAVTLADFSVAPDPIEASGLTVTFDVINQGPTPHNLTIRDSAGTILGFTSDLSTGQSESLMVTVPGPGTYITFCSLPGHESLGLVGELIVTGDASPSKAPSTTPYASPSPAL